jgi:hypothetical protein
MASSWTVMIWDILKYISFWVFVLRPSFFIVKNTEKHNGLETGSVSVLADPVFKNLCTLDYRTMDEVQKPSNPECCAPSSEPLECPCLSLVLPEIFSL